MAPSDARPPAGDALVAAGTAGDLELLRRYLAAEHRLQDLLDECITARPALSRPRLSAWATFLEDEAWRGVEALEQLQSRPWPAVYTAVTAAAQSAGAP